MRYVPVLLLAVPACSARVADNHVEWPTPVSCRVALTGTIGDAARPDGCELVVTNESGIPVDIGTTVGPVGNLSLEVTNPHGETTRVEVGSYHSPSAEVRPHVLQPGESYRTEFGLLFAVPEDQRVAGTYRVKAVYTVRRRAAESEVVEVMWPGR